MRKRSLNWSPVRKAVLAVSLLLMVLCAIGWWRSWQGTESLSLWTEAPNRAEWDKMAAQPRPVPGMSMSRPILFAGPMFSLMHDQGVVSFRRGELMFRPEEDKPIANGVIWSSPADFYTRTHSVNWTSHPQNWKRWRWSGWAFLMEPSAGPVRSTLHVSAPYWFLMLACTLPWMLEWLAVGRRRRQRRKGVCGRCNYDLRGLPAGSPCPECGES